MDDLISRSALLERLDKVAMPDDLYSLGIQRGVEHAKEVIAESPAVDAETVCKQMGLVKEAFDMAKSDLVAVVRCKDCKHGEIDDPDFPYQYYCHMGHMWNDAFHFCADGKRRADT